MPINTKQIIQLIIQPTLKDLNLYSLAAEQLLAGTCAQESGMGTYIAQVNGPALGIYQMEPVTEYDLIKNYIRYNIKLHKIMMEFPRYAEIYKTIPQKGLSLEGI